MISARTARPNVWRYSVSFDSIEHLFFITAVFVPGFIYEAVLGKFIPRHLSTMRELVLLRLFSGTALNYAVCSPIIYLLTAGSLFPNSPAHQGLAWFGIVFVAPVILAVLTAELSQANALERFIRHWPHQLRLRTISPIPTGWDWIFGRTDPCFVIVTLKDGSSVAGYFGLQSMASSDPTRRDIYLECQYVIRAHGEWVEVAQSQGAFIDGSQITCIEFRSPT